VIDAMNTEQMYCKVCSVNVYQQGSDSDKILEQRIQQILTENPRRKVQQIDIKAINNTLFAFVFLSRLPGER